MIFSHLDLDKYYFDGSVQDYGKCSASAKPMQTGNQTVCKLVLDIYYQCSVPESWYQIKYQKGFSNKQD